MAAPNPLTLDERKGCPHDLHDAGILRKGGGTADIAPMARHGVVQVGNLPDALQYSDFHHAESDTTDKVSDRELEPGMAVMASLLFAVRTRR